MLLVFGGKHCRACKLLEAFLLENEIEHRYGDIEIYSSIAARYQVMVLPTLLMLDDNNKELWRIEGFSKKELINRLKE